MKSALFLADLLGLTSCTSGSSTPTPSSKPASNPTTPVFNGELVGQVNGSDALVGFYIQGQTVKAYVCGGEKDWQTQTAWYTGTLDKETLKLSSKDGRTLN